MAILEEQDRHPVELGGADGVARAGGRPVLRPSERRPRQAPANPADGVGQEVERDRRQDPDAQRAYGGVEHVRLLAERVEVYLEGLRESRSKAEKAGDPDTVDLLTGAILEFEKHDWFLRATLAG